MSTTTFLRGFKVPLPILNAFLLAHNINESELLCTGIPPRYNKPNDKVTTLLRNKLGNRDNKTRVFVPLRTSFSLANSAYIAYDWKIAFAQRRLGPEDFADTPSPEFEDLRKEILSYADTAKPLADDARYQNAVYIVITEEQTYFPPEFKPQFPAAFTDHKCESQLQADLLRPSIRTGLLLPPPNSQLEADHHLTNEMCPTAPPQVAESRARTPTLPDNESTGELEPADAEPRLQAQSLCDAASSRGTSDPGYCRPLIPDDGGEQDEESSVVPPQAQASRAGTPSLSGDESGNEHELANTEPSMQPSASQERANLQHNIGRWRRRRRCDTDDEEDCSPTVGSDAKRGEDEDAVQPPRGKRRKAQRPPPTQGPKRRQGQRSISKPQSSGASALEEETLEAAFASFEEWPLEAVLKRVWVGGTATFQVEFTWNPCTDHGQNDRAPESPQRKPFTGRISSTARALPSRVASTTKKVQGDECFNVEEIRGWRWGKEGREYLVKWAGYGNKHNTWEPATHFEGCPEVLEEFHQKAGLSTAPSM
ncbi:hypothetical protein DHEL01_v211305 [Diaporthe helianthi]|uniref:Chromo domain-containing protein n=1 Tax=Diaporthe helianthi TaxID=158607 RepID=A0A2P5HJB1_DIAHE|nr:hypothetical protein DHEL01_v211305 [Diaporthe helianthi]